MSGKLVAFCLNGEFQAVFEKPALDQAVVFDFKYDYILICTV